MRLNLLDQWFEIANLTPGSRVLEQGTEHLMLAQRRHIIHHHVKAKSFGTSEYD